MNTISPLDAGSWTGGGSTTSNSPQKIKGAAEQFEALMIGQLLKSSREGGSSGWLGTGEQDQPGQISVELAEQQLASAMAKSGGFGLTKVITQDLQRKP
jgi:Rod binding domain-containing protein